MSVLRVYDPVECDDRGLPLDWERCRTCGGARRAPYPGTATPESAADPYKVPVCAACEGHGSLKAAALAEVGHRYPSSRDLVRYDGVLWAVGMTRRKPLTTPVGGLSVESRYDRGWVTLMRDDREEVEVAIPDLPEQPIRCEGCGHPMSDGTWEPSTLDEERDDLILWCLRGGIEPERNPYQRPFPVHYSPCDEGCRHGGALRFHPTDGSAPWVSDVVRDPLAMPGNGSETAGQVVARTEGLVEASWRQVDVRTLGWPADLRPEKLAVLCLRCWADRSSAAPAGVGEDGGA